MALWTSVLILWNVGAQAQDFDPWKEPPRGEKPVVALTLEDYEKMLLDLDVDPGGSIPQLGEGKTGVFAPPLDDKFSKWVSVGAVVTSVATVGATKRYTENWIVYRPDTILPGAVDLEYEGFQIGGFPNVLSEYAALSDAAEYRWLKFEFEYKDPPTAAGIASQVNVIPQFVTNVYQFTVITDLGGVETTSGALYRERSEVAGEVIWRDFWSLYQNYVAPSEDTGAITELVPLNVPPQAIRGFLQGQVSQPQRWFVQTKALAKPIQ